MKRIVLTVLTVLLLLSILIFVPSEMSLAEVVPIPLDRVKMADVNKDFYLSDMEYQDPSLHITMERGTWMAPFRANNKDKNDKRVGQMVGTNYLVIRVEIQDPSQLRTAIGSKNGKGAEGMKWWLSHVNPVLAITGDGYANNGTGHGRHIVRQGKLLKHNAKPIARKAKSDSFLGYDALIIDAAGDFHIIPRAEEADFEAFEGEVVNCFSFGPALVIDGELVTDFTTPEDTYDTDMGVEIRAARCCIAQTGPLSYMIVYTDSPDDPDHTGLWMQDFAELVYSLGDVQCAYNLDGGSSSHVFFNNSDYSRPYAHTDKVNRPVSDIIYFASAWQE